MICSLTLLLAVSCTGQPSGPDSSVLEDERHTVVLMGNSITEAWPDFRPGFFTGKPWVNKGVSGQVTAQMLERFAQDVVAFKPKVVVILAGTNDIAGNMGYTDVTDAARNIFDMSEMAVAAGITPVLCSVLPAADFPWNLGQNPMERIPAMNALLSGYADQHGLAYIDYFSALTDGNNGMRSELAYDSVHPNSEGYAIMEKLLVRALTDIFK